MTRRNLLKTYVYSSGTTPITDPSGEMLRTEGLTFATGYPGGLYLNASFFVPRDVLNWWELKGGQRVAFRNGQKLAYEGYIERFENVLEEGREGVLVNLTGAWGWFMMNRHWAAGARRA